MSSTSPLSADQVRADVADLLGCDPAELAPDADLLDLGLDSVRIMGLVERWRAAGATRLEFADLAEQPELGHWTALVTGAGERV
ncbi:aryl carrier-like protein [Saccharothrix tamanrassetensis]|uniref:Aryl carrier-like protein n=1 Tax=Saccharothrix tamanrassetensis TaxID=1051531 RepID=A0A841C9W3_9PSEU|nr:phosphopantetheine-binding protein [Saccharothrix tamanrassetensis]MBB5953733.1 aryl carrier-like protein [Saccharothrix tamanrassetensis]